MTLPSITEDAGRVESAAEPQVSGAACFDSVGPNQSRAVPVSGGRFARCVAAGVLTLGIAASAVAQQAPATPPSEAHFLPRFDFAMSAAALGYDDDRFSWDTHWTGDLDLLDYGYGRATFLGDYQALTGSEFRPFDPYQSSYLLEASGSIRAGGIEIAGVLNHVSRHLGDRFKRLAVAENSLGIRATRRFGRGNTSLDARVDVRKVIARAYVDYASISDLDLALRHAVGRGTTLYGHVFGQYDTVDRAIAGRAGQYGGRLEAGIEVAGKAGAADLFVGSERVIDADPLDRVPRRWVFFGFRLISR